jgi:heme-degrading monooxygenase HmoA
MIAFINCFTVPAGREDEFLDLWTAVNVYMAAKPGYVDHQLRRSLEPGATYRFVNFAHWESAEAWSAAHDEGFRALVTAPEWSDFGSLPALYESEPVHQGSRAAGEA